MTTYTRKDFQTDQEVRWCPGCGDYTILAAVQGFMAELGIPREQIVFVSGIGCAARLPYYMNTYGLHGIHGRAAAIASGLATARPDLSVWVVSGDGDSLSIGGNHFIHAFRRNVNIKLLLFNNQVYGLTKGQYSPTTELGKITKTSPMGTVDWPFNPVSLALGAEATFVARTIDMDRAHTTEMLGEAFRHKGSALIEIYQNCNVFNDKAFIELTGREQRDANRINLEHGKPVIFGASQEKAVVMGQGGAKVVNVADVDPSSIYVHDAGAADPSAAFALSRLSHGPHGPTPVGLFRSVERPTYDELVGRKLAEAQQKKGPGDLAALIAQNGTWTAN